MAVSRPGARRRSMKYDAVVLREVAGHGKRQAERACEVGPARVDIGNNNLRARDPPCEVAGQQADNASPDDCHAVARLGAGVPMGVQRRFHVGGQRRAARRDVVRHHRQHVFGHLKMILVGMQAEHGFTEKFVRSCGYDAGRRIAVFHGVGKRAGLERGAHACPFAFRHLAVGDQALGAAANGAELGGNAGFTGAGGVKAFGAQFRNAGLDVPQAARHHDLAETAARRGPGGGRSDGRTGTGGLFVHSGIDLTKTMSERTDKVEPPVSGQPAGADGPLNTTSLSSPAGLQANATLNGRRLAVLSVNLVTWGLLLASFASLLSVGGWTWVDRILFVCFVFGTPWSVLGFWNAMIGLWLLAGGKARLADVAPFLAAADGKEPLAIRTAVLMTLRNEDPSRAILRLKTVKASLDATGEGQAFSYFILSDTSRDDVAADEQAIIAAWRAADPDGARIVYRRRTDNAGFKAGNVRDFCMRWGQDFELMLPLDADSLMTGAAIVRLVRIMQTHPRIGILQSLVVGTPSSSAFARIFQFGMRHGMRAYTMGQAWWVGDCGPYWGHNALVRIAPFVEHCDLPVLPGRPPLGGHVLSHDQVEATLMRRAGFEVRVMPVEDGSYEDNPPDALVFIGRDVRWCQGNMQYLKLLNLPGLLPISRFQLVWAISDVSRHSGLDADDRSIAVCNA